MRTIGLVSTFAALLAGAPLAAQAQTFRTRDVLRPTQIPQVGQQVGPQLGQQVGPQLGQQVGRRSNANIPRGQLAPAGMCRIWIDGVPPGRQPAPMDCQTAMAIRPANSRVLFGNQQIFPGNGSARFDSQQRLRALAVNRGRNRRGNDVENDNDADDGPRGTGSTQSPAVRVSHPVSGRDFSVKGNRHGNE